jgi:hypothetical protein
MVIRQTAAKLQMDAGGNAAKLKKDDDKVKKAKIYGAQGMWYLPHRRNYTLTDFSCVIPVCKSRRRLKYHKAN